MIKTSFLLLTALALFLFVGCASKGGTQAGSDSASNTASGTSSNTASDSAEERAERGEGGSGLLMDRYRTGEIPGLRD